MKSKEKEVLIRANLCRGFMHCHDFITFSEMEKIHSRIIKYRDKHEIVVSDEELSSCGFTLKSAEQRITELEEALKHIVELSSLEYIQEHEKGSFLKEFNEWTLKAKELLKTE